MAMTTKQIVHNYMLSAVKKSKKKIQIKCTTVKGGKAVYSAIFEGWPTYAAYIEKVKSGINYKDFTLKFDKEWATEEFFNILLAVKADSSLKVQEPAPTPPPTPETDKFDDPTQPAPTNNTNPTTYTGSTYAAPGSGAFTKIAGTTGNNNKTFIIAGAAVLVLVLVLVLLKRK